MIELNHTLAVNTGKHQPLSIEQIWNGLILRITEQTRFTPGLDAVEIIEQNADETDTQMPTRYRRILSFGSHQVRDLVHVIHHESIEFITEAREDAPSGRLLIQVNPDLSLTFSYTTQFPEARTDEEKQLLDMVKAAYHAADSDMIRIIREQALAIRH